MFTGRFGSIFSPKPLEKIAKKNSDEEKKILQNNQIFTQDARDNGEVVITMGRHTGGIQSAASKLDMVSYTNYVQEFYDIAEVPEVEEAIDIITNEVVAVEDGDEVMTLDLDALELSDTLRQKIQERFDHVLDITGINENGFDIFRDWFVSGRQGFYMIPHKNPNKGLEGVVMLDPRHLRSITRLEYERDFGTQGDVPTIKAKEKGYVYDTSNQQKSGGGISNNAVGSTFWIPHESVVYVDSGLKKGKNGLVPSRLEKAIKTANNLTTVEDATVIYAITRAPERRAFYLDVGTLGTNAAKAYMEEMMSNYQTELNYDRTTGKVVNNQSTMGIVEDFWMPRREGANATEIQTLDGGQQLGEMRHVFYFKEKLYTALKIPKGRLDSQGGMVNIGGSDLAEVDREERRFNKYTRRLGRAHASIIKQILLTDLLLTKVITYPDLKEISKYIQVFYNADSYIVEQQESETIANRINNLQTIEPYVGQIISRRYALTKILRMSDEEIEAEANQIAKEVSENAYGGEEGVSSPLKRPDAGGF